MPVGLKVKEASAHVKFKRPLHITAIVVYEDNSGPVPGGNTVLQTVAPHYGIYAHDTESDRWVRVGYVVNNTNLVNIFAVRGMTVDQIRYFWAGREFASMTDEMVRMAEMEVYSTEEAELGLEELPELK